MGIEIKHIDQEYAQQGGICVLACYGGIIHFFSKGNIKPREIPTKFTKLFKELDKELQSVLQKSERSKRVWIKENMIGEYFNNHCRSSGDKRGFDYISELHTADTLTTGSYCTILANNALKDSFIPIEEKNQLRERLKQESSIAMVLYLAKLTLLHAIIIGYDNSKEQYFIKDPEKKTIEYGDFLENNNITEYILFGAKGIG